MLRYAVKRIAQLIPLLFFGLCRGIYDGTRYPGRSPWRCSWARECLPIPWNMNASGWA